MAIPDYDKSSAMGYKQSPDRDLYVRISKDNKDMAIILTVKPEHFERIKSGEKQYEFRKTYIRKWIGNDVYFCISGTKGEVLGKCRLNYCGYLAYCEDSKGDNDLTREERNYIHKPPTGAYMYEISGFQPCDLNISDFGLKRVPQSFQYVEDLV